MLRKEYSAYCSQENSGRALLNKQASTKAI
jgi:hypothetical protein